VVAHAVHNGITEIPGSHDVIPGESSHNEPFPVTAEALVAALKAADQLGRTLG
jgi:glycerol dehydrogenase-like iron-containing ADH family enzyme